MEARMSREQAINWLKNAQKRQQEWQQEVKQRSARATIEGQGFYAAIIVENRNPLLTDITADFDRTAVTLTNKSGD